LSDQVAADAEEKRTLLAKISVLKSEYKKVTEGGGNSTIPAISPTTISQDHVNKLDETKKERDDAKAKLQLLTIEYRKLQQQKSQLMQALQLKNSADPPRDTVLVSTQSRKRLPITVKQSDSDDGNPFSNTSSPSVPTKSRISDDKSGNPFDDSPAIPLKKKSSNSDVGKKKIQSQSQSLNPFEDGNPFE